MCKTGFSFVLFSLVYFNLFATFDNNIRVREALVIVFIVGLLTFIKVTKEKLSITLDSWVLIAFVPLLFVMTAVTVVNFSDVSAIRFLLFSLENFLFYIVLRTWFSNNKDHSKILQNIKIAWFLFVISVVVTYLFDSYYGRLGGPNGVAFYVIALAVPLISNSISMKRYDHFLFIFFVSFSLAFVEHARAAMLILSLISAMNLGLSLKGEHLKLAFTVFSGLAVVAAMGLGAQIILEPSIDVVSFDYSKRDELILLSIFLISEANLGGFGLGSAQHIIPPGEHYPHNAILFIAIELGAVGVLLFLLFLISNLVSTKFADQPPFSTHGKIHLSFWLTMCFALLISHWTFQVLNFFTPMMFLLALLTPGKSYGRA